MSMSSLGRIGRIFSGAAESHRKYRIIVVHDYSSDFINRVYYTYLYPYVVNKRFFTCSNKCDPLTRGVSGMRVTLPINAHA